MTQIPFKNLRIIGRLGNGAFGLVRLVEDDRNPGQTYALKAVSKLKVVRSKQESHLINERRILLRVKHPYVTRLYDTYQDDRSVFFLLEPCLGGELFTILRSRTSFSERTSQYYAATVVEIFDYLQQRNIVYRDLKPENLLLDSKGEFLTLTLTLN
jgi:cGMP-dependent protein kinase